MTDQTRNLQQAERDLEELLTSMEAALPPADDRVEVWQMRANAATAKYGVAALGEHGQSLKDAARASEQYSRRLVWATWALVFATLVLAVTSIFAG